MEEIFVQKKFFLCIFQWEKKWQWVFVHQSGKYTFYFIFFKYVHGWWIFIITMTTYTIVTTIARPPIFIASIHYEIKFFFVDYILEYLIALLLILVLFRDIYKLFLYYYYMHNHELYQDSKLLYIDMMHNSYKKMQILIYFFKIFFNVCISLYAWFLLFLFYVLLFGIFYFGLECQVLLEHFCARIANVVILLDCLTTHFCLLFCFCFLTIICNNRKLMLGCWMCSNYYWSSTCKHKPVQALLPKVQNIAPALLVVQDPKVHQPKVVQTFEPMVVEQEKFGVHAVDRAYIDIV